LFATFVSASGFAGGSKTSPPPVKRATKWLAEAHHLLQETINASNQLPRHWKIRAVTYSELASLYTVEGNYREAEKFRRDELSLREKFDGPRAPETVVAASNLATLLDDAGKSSEAEPLHRPGRSVSSTAPGACEPDACTNWGVWPNPLISINNPWLWQSRRERRGRYSLRAASTILPSL
jgi:Tetratricopeptide repeat